VSDFNTISIKIMGGCQSSSVSKTNTLKDLFLSARDSATKRTFDIAIHPEYEEVCDDVIIYFQSKGWVIHYKRYQTLTVTLPPKKSNI